MPNNKQTPRNSNTKPTETKARKVSTKKSEQVAESVVEKQHMETSSHNEFNHETKTKKTVRKAGRTLLVKSVSGSSLTPGNFDSLVGLVSKSQTKSDSSIFLTFDTVQNALSAFRKLRTDSTDYRVKFSYYRLFFTMNGLTESTDYNQVKTDMVNYVNSNAKTNVLYCKFYRKDSKFVGCGDLTVDTLEGMNALLSKEGGLKEYGFGPYSGTFYRYNKKPQGQQQSAVSSQ
jgi:hypothetical protein